jgi:hypothetical protein
MRPEIENLKARMSGLPLTKYQMALSKTEYVKLLDYVAELEQLRIHDVVELREQFLNMQYYMEYCQMKGYVTPQEWIENHKHF